MRPADGLSRGRRAFLPGLKKLCEEVHAADRVVHFHCDANMCKLTEEMVAAGVDIYQSIEPHEPMVEGVCLPGRCYGGPA